ncbi:MAG: ABC transporter ATP-binding protein [Actinomycetales bacterium]|nr:ABC transporter ATP-binding protein [Actinomycetales bacterium]
MTGPALTLDGLTKSFGDLTAVSDLHATVEQGEVFGLLGPNGAGKTTTIRMISGELRPDRGQVLLRGHPLRASADDRARIGVCPQENVLWDKLTCREQLEFTGRMYGLSRPLARRRADDLLEELGLVEKARARGGALSGGQRRRLSIALALVHEPELVILDEPSAGLDPQSRALVRDVVRSRARVASVVLTTHDMDEADRLSDRVAVVDRGRLLACGPPAELRSRLGGGVVELRFFGGGEDAAVAALSTVPDLAVQAGPGLVSVRTDRPSTVLPGLLAALDERGAPADEVRLRSPSLEDVFLELTGRSLRS